jgi:hypothetical protein
LQKCTLLANYWHKGGWCMSMHVCMFWTVY